MSKAMGMLLKPTLEEIKLLAAKIGLPEREAEKFFYHYEANGWKVGKNPMKCWKSALSGWRVRWQERGGAVSSGRPLSGIDKVILEKEYERILEKMKTLKNAYSPYAAWKQAELDLWATLRARKAELAKKLGILI